MRGSTATKPGMSAVGELESPVERTSICFPHHGTQDVLQRGDAAFKDELHRWYSPAENEALEYLVKLKADMRRASQDDFWAITTEGLSKLLGADISFVMKRVLVDDQESAVEMPPIGEPGSCIMAAALHYHALDDSRATTKATKFHAYGCPCAYMRHDKVFLVPERLNDFITNNPNTLPTPCEAYIALPLLDEGKSIGHFGAMWSTERAPQRKLSWATIELLMHSLEDAILSRFLQGANFIRPTTEKQRVIPHDAITVAQSLRPYAGSLSHELRTPMQGIVGMLDIMYATVQEAVETQSDPRLRKVFEQLKDNIETVQDSSRRAVEAADNVVHAYDMDMSIPEAPAHLHEDLTDLFPPHPGNTDKRPGILVAGSNLPLSRPNKRRRETEGVSRSDSNASTGSAKKARMSRASHPCTHCSDVIPIPDDPVEPAGDIPSPDLPAVAAEELPVPFMALGSRIIAPGLRHTSLRELLQLVIDEGLKVGGRPDSAKAQETDTGEIIEVRTRGSDGTIGQKTIQWSIDHNVPATMFIDEKDLSKLISCVFRNAIKFTDRYQGKVNVVVRMSQRGRFISIKVSDNGPGIPAEFLPHLFKAFSQQNGSITRSIEGLGLGLMVAKGIARKLGGDLNCTKAVTEGEQHGTEFEIKVPLQAGETISRPGSPFQSPRPRQVRPQFTADTTQHIRPLPAAPNSPRHLGRALHDVVNPSPFAPAAIRQNLPTTPPSPKSATTDISADVIAASLAVQSLPSSPSPSPPLPAIAESTHSRPQIRKPITAVTPSIDRDLAKKYPLTFLVAEDNKINRKLLVSMLSKFGYKNIIEAHDGAEAVRQMSIPRAPAEQVDVVLMDLWMPLMDGYEATERILRDQEGRKKPTVLAVTADVTDGALERAAECGMKGFMTKPYKLMDLQRLIQEYCGAWETERIGEGGSVCP